GGLPAGRIQRVGDLAVRGLTVPARDHPRDDHPRWHAKCCHCGCDDNVQQVPQSPATLPAVLAVLARTPSRIDIPSGAAIRRHSELTLVPAACSSRPPASVPPPRAPGPPPR